VDGTKLRVQMIHKPLEDYFTALRAVGFTKMPIVKELRVLPEHMAENPAFFGGGERRAAPHGLPRREVAPRR
jgi:hypothetical protein